jgi:hypothetical protein
MFGYKIKQEKQGTAKRNIEVRSCNHGCSRKLIALFIQHSTRMRRNILLSVACQALPHFPTLYAKRQIFQKIGYLT